MEPLIDSREVTLVTPGGLSASAVVRALTGLQMFEYQELLLTKYSDWPQQPEHPASDSDMARYMIAVQKHVSRLNLLMAAFGLSYQHPDKTIDQVIEWVAESYPNLEHHLRLAMAVKSLSGLEPPVQTDAGSEQEVAPLDPKKG
ncbi:hypothetical protein VCX44_16900 [Aeromonas caviae]|uniref:Uncharacterized protein n=1 Tax=Aeromonas caviae TaxID=648 RepID=A0ABU5WBT8_AERCA|nr:hypothetical protein [Aeromonas caviae]MEA9437437.1 hypothetical protein [Aeromonas caviae]